MVPDLDPWVADPEPCCRFFPRSSLVVNASTLSQVRWLISVLIAELITGGFGGGWLVADSVSDGVGLGSGPHRNTGLTRATGGRTEIPRRVGL